VTPAGSVPADDIRLQARQRTGCDEHALAFAQPGPRHYLVRPFNHATDRQQLLFGHRGGLALVAEHVSNPPYARDVTKLRPLSPDEKIARKQRLLHPLSPVLPLAQDVPQRKEALDPLVLEAPLCHLLVTGLGVDGIPLQMIDRRKCLG